MKKSLYVLLLAFFISVPVLSEEIIKSKNGKMIKLKDDNTWEYMEKYSGGIIKAADAVTVWNTELLRQDTKYEKSIGLYIHYKNNTPRRVVGVTILITVSNPFGKVLWEELRDDEVVLRPRERLQNNAYFNFKDNQFIDDEPYDRIWRIADNGTAKINTRILKVIFDNGEVLTNESKK